MPALAPDADLHLGGVARLAPVGTTVLDALDDEVRRTVEHASARAEEVVVQHRRTLDTLVDALIESEHVEGTALARLLAPIALPSRPRKAAAAG